MSETPAAGSPTASRSRSRPADPDTTFQPLSSTWTLQLPRGRPWLLGERLQVMGILNLTPDSFSDGGQFDSPEQAVARALEMVEQGADILDLGAESTRPAGAAYGDGAREVTAAEEIDRLLPVLTALRSETDTVISVDTRKGAVARAALAAGADLINDVTGVKDPELGDVVARAGCPLIVAHSRGELSGTTSREEYDEVMDDVVQELAAFVRRAEYRNVPFEQVIIDPGIGYSKGLEENLEIVNNLDFLEWIDRPVLLGASRKAFIGELTGAPTSERLPGSLAAVLWAAVRQIAIVRVHDVLETVRFLKVWDAVRNSQRRLL